MGTVYRRPNLNLASVLTTRLITISTLGTLVTATSGAKAMQVFNVGQSLSIAWGDSSITASSAGLLYYSMSEIFNPIQGEFATWFMADSIAGTIAVNEFE